MEPSAAVVEISDNDELYRLLTIDHVSEEAGERYVNSAGYKLGHKPDPQASVYLRSLTALDELRTQNPAKGIGLVSVRDVRALGLRVYHRPEQDAEGHAEIEGMSGPQAKDVCRRLSRLTRVVVEPPPRPYVDPL